MKKMILLAASLLLFAAAAFAQEPAKPYKVYCAFVSETRVLSYECEVDMDYGQEASSWTTDRRLYDEKGKTLKFNSVMDAVNYLGRKGWVLEECSQVLTPTNVGSDNPSYRWIMSKMITDDSQILEGLITGAMLKK